GHSPHWRDLYPHAHTVDLPTYPFQHHRYWLEPPPALMSVLLACIAPITACWGVDRAG
ncbi:hypothetical protein H7I94_23860, partial [Mycobacterium szulgai]|nr:hypothetical protein [Mycobacterium szulgai]